MKRALTWFFLFNKRLYKKSAFIILLALIPVLVLAFETVAQDESGFVRIALAQENPNDPLSREIIDELLDGSKLLFFTEASSPDVAISMVKNGSADAAWIFPGDTENRLKTFSETLSEENYVVTVIQREQTIPLRLSHEKLCNSVYKHCSRTLYVNYARKNVSELDALSDEELYQYYNEFEKENELFSFSDSEISENNKNYLLAPLRGLLSIIVFLCALSATMFFIQDKKSGTFSLVSEEKLPLVGFFCQLIATLNVGLVMLVSLLVTGLTVSIWRELLILILFCFSCAAFCSLLHLFIKNIKILSSLIPLLVVLSIAICPVFFNFNSAFWIQILLPPTHYINAAYNNTFLLYMVLYCFVLASLFFLFSKALHTQLNSRGGK